MFINERLKELDSLLEGGHFNAAFVLSIIGIELLGALEDDKPLRADKQSFKRFRLGIRRFFDKKYGRLEIIDTLYKAVRCNVSHLGLKGGKCTFVETSFEHLVFDDLSLQINKEQFINDYIKALTKCKTKIDSGLISLKKGLI